MGFNLNNFLRSNTPNIKELIEQYNDEVQPIDKIRQLEDFYFYQNYVKNFEIFAICQPNRIFCPPKDLIIWHQLIVSSLYLNPYYTFNKNFNLNFNIKTGNPSKIYLDIFDEDVCSFTDMHPLQYPRLLKVTLMDHMDIALGKERNIDYYFTESNLRYNKWIEEVIYWEDKIMLMELGIKI